VLAITREMLENAVVTADNCCNCTERTLCKDNVFVVDADVDDAVDDDKDVDDDDNDDDDDDDDDDFVSNADDEDDNDEDGNVKEDDEEGDESADVVTGGLTGGGRDVERSIAIVSGGVVVLQLM
jgi:hypothetical protein